MAMTERGNVYSWGRGTSGQLGHGDAVDRYTNLLADRKSEKNKQNLLQRKIRSFMKVTDPSSGFAGPPPRE